MSMERSYNKLTEEQEDFFRNLSTFIGEKIYFYGSIQRIDYIQGKSDIDIDIFTNDTSNLIQKICTFIDSEKHQFKKTILNINGKVIYGFKTFYTNQIDNIKAEISVFNQSYKDVVLKDRLEVIYLPLYKVIFLYIVKILYYHFSIISIDIYRQMKRLIMNSSEIKFIALDINN